MSEVREDLLAQLDSVSSTNQLCYEAAIRIRELEEELRKARALEAFGVGQIEQKATAVLRRLAPKGATVTPELLAQAKTEIVQLVIDEMKEAGMPVSAITSMKAALDAMIKLKVTP